MQSIFCSYCHRVFVSVTLSFLTKQEDSHNTTGKINKTKICATALEISSIKIIMNRKQFKTYHKMFLPLLKTLSSLPFTCSHVKQASGRCRSLPTQVSKPEPFSVRAQVGRSSSRTGCFSARSRPGGPAEKLARSRRAVTASVDVMVGGSQRKHSVCCGSGRRISGSCGCSVTV